MSGGLPRGSELVSEIDDLVDDATYGFFMVDNEVIDVFGPELGATGLALYCVLKRYCRATPGWDGPAAWPGLDKLAAVLAVHRTTVQDYLTRLVSANLVYVEARYRADGGRTTNRYHLLAVKKVLRLRAAGGNPAPAPSPPPPPPPPPPGPPPSGLRPPTRRHTGGRVGPVSAAYPVEVPTGLSPSTLPPPVLTEVQRDCPHVDVTLALKRFAKHFAGQGFPSEERLWARLLEWLLEDEAETVGKLASGGTNRHVRATVPAAPLAPPTATLPYYRAPVRGSAEGGAV